ncbi:hypothetical protein RB601_009894 [Gaeumannomyces tritici]
MAWLDAQSLAATVVIGTIGGIAVIYAGFLCLCAIPFVQRNAVYAYRINSLLWSNVNKPERWGFAKNQVTPFWINVPGSESKVYAWHVMPLNVYAKHEERLLKQAEGPHEDFTHTETFKTIKADPNSRVVISFHGNAGHIAQGVRPQHYHCVAMMPSTHVITMDYRGFGHSPGSPTEDGLIADGIATVYFVLHVLEIPASRVVIIGQSLGTAVASAVAERFSQKGIDFAGIVLVAGFSSLPTMLSGYAIGGVLPVLKPLTLCPPLLRMFMRCVIDKWESANRLAEMVRVVLERDGHMHLQLVHAINDGDIPCIESDKLFAAAVKGAADLDDKALADLKDELTVRKGLGFSALYTQGHVKISQELVTNGGHNDVMLYAAVQLTLTRALEGCVGRDMDH